MASVRKRPWINSKGEPCEAWVADARTLGAGQKQFARKKDAEAHLRRIREEIESQTYVAKREQWTVQQLWEDKDRGWKQELKKRRNRKQIRQSRVDIAKAMRLHILPEWGDHPLTDVTRDATQCWVDRVLNVSDGPKTLHRRGRPYSVSTVRGWIAELSQMLDWAIEKGIGLRRNPFIDDGKKRKEGLAIKFPPDDARDPVPLQMPAAQRVLRWATQKTRRLWQRTDSWGSSRMAILVALLAGLRAGEICALDWSDIDFNKRKLRIWRSYSRVYGMGPTKNGKERNVPISGVLHAALLGYHEWRGCPADGPLLIASDGDRMCPRHLGSKHWPGVQVHIGLVDPSNDRKLHHSHTFHDLRHTAGSYWLAAKMPLEIVSDWLGHSNMAFTKRVYIHEVEHDNRGALALQGLTDNLVERMAACGVYLPASEPLLLEAPEVVESEVLENDAELLPARPLTVREEMLVELWRRGGYLVDVAREVGVSPQDASALLERLGIKDRRPRPRPSRFSDEDRAKAIELYLETNPDGSARHTQEWIASQIGAESTTTIREWFRDAGLEPRGNGPKAARVAWAKRPEVRQLVLDMWQRGDPLKEIIRASGCKETTITRFVKQAGLPLRRPRRDVVFELDAAPMQHDLWKAMESAT
jgi:integrase